MIRQDFFQLTNTGLQIFDDAMIALWQQFKILYPIVCAVTILMMNVFMGLKWATKMLTHYKTMFVNFTSFIGHWILGLINLDITSTLYPLSLGAIKTTFEERCVTEAGNTETSITTKGESLQKILDRNPSLFFALSAHDFDKGSSPCIFLRGPSVTERIPMNHRSTFQFFISSLEHMIDRGTSSRILNSLFTHFGLPFNYRGTKRTGQGGLFNALP